MNDEEQALLAAIIANPDDDLPRLVYADWLDEHDQPERAEFIRVQVELARMVIRDAATENRYEVLSARERELLAGHYHEWEDGVAGQFPKNRQTHFWFRRGLVGEVWCTVRFFRENADLLLSLAPIQEVYLRRPTPKGVAEVAEVPAFGQFPDLKLDADEVSIDVFRRLLNASVRHLRSLEVSSRVSYGYDSAPPRWAERSAAIVERIAACDQLSGLRRLDLRQAGIGEEGGRALAQSASLAALKVLLLTGNPLSEPTKNLLRGRFGERVFFDYPDYRGRLAVADIR